MSLGICWKVLLLDIDLNYVIATSCNPRPAHCSDSCHVYQKSSSKSSTEMKFHEGPRILAPDLNTLRWSTVTVRHPRRRQRSARCPYPKNTFAARGSPVGPSSSARTLPPCRFGAATNWKLPSCGRARAHTVASIEIN